MEGALMGLWLLLSDHCTRHQECVSTPYRPRQALLSPTPTTPPRPEGGMAGWDPQNFRAPPSKMRPATCSWHTHKSKEQRNNNQALMTGVGNDISSAVYAQLAEHKCSAPWPLEMAQISDFHVLV